MAINAEADDGVEQTQKQGLGIYLHLPPINLFDLRVYVHFFLGASLGYVLIAFWLWSTAHFVVEIQGRECDKLGGGETLRNLEDVRKDCDELFASNVSTIHNVTFGLLTAVVVFQLGESTAKARGGGLYGKYHEFMFGDDGLETKFKEWIDSSSFCLVQTIRHFIYSSSIQYVLFSTHACVIAWICGGVICLYYGSIWGAVESGPLHTTGQAWLGIAVTTMYSFFGVDQKGGDQNEGLNPREGGDEQKGGEGKEETPESGDKRLATSISNNDDDPGSNEDSNADEKEDNVV